MFDVTYVGFLAIILMNISALPQIFKTVKTKRVDDMTVWRELLLFSGTGLYLYYGLAINNIVIIISNVVAVIVFSTLILLHVFYGGLNGQKTFERNK